MDAACDRPVASTGERVHVNLIVSHQLVGTAAGHLAVQGSTAVLTVAAPSDLDVVAAVVHHVISIETEYSFRRAMDAESRFAGNN